MDDGKRVPLSTRVSEATAAALDAARGTMSRSAALDAALSMWLAAQNGARPRQRAAADLDRAGQQAIISDVMTRHPDGTPRKKTRSTPAAPLPAGKRVRCPHPGTRVIGGWCPQCGAVVGSDGYLP